MFPAFVVFRHIVLPETTQCNNVTHSLPDHHNISPSPCAMSLYEIVMYLRDQLYDCAPIGILLNVADRTSVISLLFPEHTQKQHITDYLHPQKTVTPYTYTHNNVVDFKDCLTFDNRPLHFTNLAYPVLCLVALCGNARIALTSICHV